MNPIRELKKIADALEQFNKQADSESLNQTQTALINLFEENPEIEIKTLEDDTRVITIQTSKDCIHEITISEPIEKEKKEGAISKQDIATEISSLLTQLDNLVNSRANIERAIHEIEGEDSTLSKSFYDADVHIDEAIRSFKMLRNEALGI